MTYFCARCGRVLGGPLGAACPSCRGQRPARIDLLVALLVGLAFGAACLWRWL